MRARVVRWRIDPGGAARGRTIRESVIIQVMRPSGAIGYGEAAPLAPGDSIGRVLRALEGDLTSPSARFAVETAELDALAKERGVPLATLLGTAVEPRPFAVVVDQPIATTAGCIKIKVGPGGDLDRIRAIAAANPGATLRLDANQTWPRETVHARLAALADLPIEFVEEPCVDAHTLGPLPLPLALDESLVDPDVDLANVSVVVLKPSLLGGFAACRAIADRARARGIGVVVTHGLEGPIGTAACAALAVVIGDRAAGLAPHPALAAWDIELNCHRENTGRTNFQEPGLGIDVGALEENGRANFQHAQPGLGIDVGALEENGRANFQHAQPGLGIDVGALENASRENGRTNFQEPGLGIDVGALENASRENGRTNFQEPGLGIDVGALEDAIVALRDPLSTSGRGSSGMHASGAPRERCLVATPTRETIDAIHAALDERRPLALIHQRLPADEQARQRAMVEHAALDEGEVVLFTSGSTGAARGVVLSREALIAATEANAAHLGWRDDDRWLLALSMAHAGGLAVVVRCLAARRECVLAGESLADALAECTLASLVPTQLAQLLDDPAWTPPPQLRAVLLGGAAASPALLEAAAARGVPFLTTYGMTESFGQVATAPLARAGHPDAPLVPLAHVVLEAGTRARPASIRVRAPQLARRYLDGAPIAPVFTTNDLGYLEGGALCVVGRADDVIITGGENVHPDLVEAVLTATPGVRAACAFGVDDDRWGQRVVAALAVDPSFELAPALARWHAALPPHARPREIATVSTLPVSPNGKLDRRAAARIPRARV